MVDCTNHIWRISNLHCKSFMAWLTVQTILGELVIFAVNSPWHGWMAQSNLVSPTHCNDVLLKELFFIVCGKPNAILWHFLKNMFYARYLSCMVYYMARPNYPILYLNFCLNCMYAL